MTVEKRTMRCSLRWYFLTLKCVPFGFAGLIFLSGDNLFTGIDFCCVFFFKIFIFMVIFRHSRLYLYYQMETVSQTCENFSSHSIEWFFIAIFGYYQLCSGVTKNEACPLKSEPSPQSLSP